MVPLAAYFYINSEYFITNGIEFENPIEDDSTGKIKQNYNINFKGYIF